MQGVEERQQLRTGRALSAVYATLRAAELLVCEASHLCTGTSASTATGSSALSTEKVGLAPPC